MASEQAALDPDTTPLTAADPPAPSSDEVARLLETVRSTVQTAVLADVMTLIAETEAPEQSELQRRARAIQVELTLRRQEVALEEWRRKLAAAEREAERQRQLFARLEADFARRAADFARRSADFERNSADFERRSADFERSSADFERRSADFERGSADFERRSADFERRTAEFEERSIDFARRSSDFEQQSAELRRAAALARETERETERVLTAAVQALEQRADQLTRELAAASDLDQARQQMILTLEQDLARARQEKSDLDELLARRETVLTEAQRRVEELRNSRWRQLGIGFGLAKRATFEK